MDAAEILVRRIERDSRLVIFEFFAESNAETGKTSLLHPKREILPLDVGR
jgi:hypothetical protein